MKKVFKKILTALLIVIVLFNFTLLEPVSFAADTLSETLTNLLGSFVGILTWLFRLPAIGVAFVANVLTAGIAYMDGATPGNSANATITPFEIFSNKVQLFDINFFDFSSSLENTAVYKIRMSVAQWFYIMRLIAVSILLVILIYVGIRMAITTIAEDKARYKQMLIDWVTSLFLVFVLQFIIIFTVNVNNALVNTIMQPFGGNDEVNNVISDLALKGLGFSTEALGATVVYCMIVWQTFGFVLAYLNRTIKIAFLIIISPLISITYAIDKMGDGKSQALNAWLKEFIYSVLMQPFHCVIYITLVNIAFDLLVEGKHGGVAEAIIAILCIKFVKTAEDLVRRIFNFEDDNKGTSLAAGTAVAAAAISKSKDIGKTARKGINFVKESKLTDSLKQDGVKVKAAVQALRLTDEERKAKKEGGHVASYSARIKREEASIQKQQAEKKERKENAKVEKFYKKHGEKYQNEIDSKAKEIKAANPGMSDKESLKQARQVVSKEKIASGAYKNKIVKGYRSAKKFANSLNTVQAFKKTILPAGIGMGLGFMAYGGDANAMNAGMLAVAAGKSGMEFMQNSTGTLAGEISNQLMGKGEVIPGNVESILQDIKASGESGKYDNDNLKAILNELRKAVGNNNIADAIVKEINRNFAQGNLNFNLEGILQGQKDIFNADKTDSEKVNFENDKIQEIIEKMQALKDFNHDSAIYQAISNGAQVGISVETLSEKTADDIDAEFTKYDFKQMAKTTKITETIVKAVHSREDEYKLDTMITELDAEKKKVENQIEEIRNKMSGMNADQRRAAKINIANLESSKKMLNTNITEIENIESNIS